MKRFLVVSVAFVLCNFLTGCATDTHDGLLQTTVNLMGQAASDVGNIKEAVDTAVDAFKKNPEGSAKLNLADAILLTDKLKDTGKELQKLKKRITEVKANITEQDRKTNAEKHRQKLNGAFADLLKKREELKVSLDEAEKLNNPHAKLAVTELRAKLVDAESPFEAMAR